MRQLAHLEELGRALVRQPLMPAVPVGELQRRNRRRRHRHVAEAAGSLAVAAGLVGAATLPAGHGTSRANGAGGSRLAAYIVAAGEVPDGALQDVGLPASVVPPRSLTGQPAIDVHGKPAVVFVGAAYCPFCALERWALVVALSKFGNFSHLGQAVSSASSDIYPGLKSWSFRGSTYSSPYLSFVASGPVEPEATLSPTSLSGRLVHRYDVPPYVLSAAQSGSIPFLDIDNRYLQIGSSAAPSVLEGVSLDQISTDLAEPASPVAKAVDGSANYLIAALCLVTGQQPSGLCDMSVVAKAEARLQASSVRTTVPNAVPTTIAGRAFTFTVAPAVTGRNPSGVTR